jgi:hypothetical protein
MLPLQARFRAQHLRFIFSGGSMASTLIGGRGKDRETEKGHGTSALGPSDTSDSASDMTGAPGVVEGDVIGLDHGTYEDIDGSPTKTAGADIGDVDLDSDSDSVGTGEHMTAGREPIARENRDLRPDHIERIPGAGDGDALLEVNREDSDLELNEDGEEADSDTGTDRG